MAWLTRLISLQADHHHVTATPYSLLPTAYCLLPTPYCLLPAVSHRVYRLK